MGRSGFRDHGRVPPPLFPRTFLHPLLPLHPVFAFVSMKCCLHPQELRFVGCDYLCVNLDLNYSFDSCGIPAFLYIEYSSAGARSFHFCSSSSIVYIASLFCFSNVVSALPQADLNPKRFRSLRWLVLCIVGQSEFGRSRQQCSASPMRASSLDVAQFDFLVVTRTQHSSRDNFVNDLYVIR